MTFSNDWDDLLKEEMEKPYYKDLRRLLIEEYKTQTIYPEADAVFRAMRLTSFHDTKVLLLGQDPYHGPGQAQGMSFSVPEDFPLPPDKVVQLLGEREKPMVFILWGAHARSKKRLVKNPAHRIIESPHPSPLSAYRGFFGSKCFSRTNEYLIAMGDTPVDWR